MSEELLSNALPIHLESTIITPSISNMHAMTIVLVYHRFRGVLTAATAIVWGSVGVAMLLSC